MEKTGQIRYNKISMIRTEKEMKNHGEKYEKSTKTEGEGMDVQHPQ